LKKSDLKYMLQLIDDEQIEIRNEVLQQLEKYGSSLEIDIKEFSSLLDEQKRQIIDPLIKKNRINKIKEEWYKLQYITDEYAKLEYAHRLIAQFQYGNEAFTESLKCLDETAVEFSAHFPYGNEIDLANFLFQKKAISGNKNDYYNPYNSNVLFALKERKGIPITLCTLFILIGNRLNMHIEGCNFPGHFLAKIVIDGDVILIDCYNKGKLIYEEEIGEVRGFQPNMLNDIIHRTTDINAIIRRTVNNLINAYRHKKDNECELLFETLLKYEI